LLSLKYGIGPIERSSTIESGQSSLFAGEVASPKIIESIPLSDHATQRMSPKIQELARLTLLNVNTILNLPYYHKAFID